MLPSVNKCHATENSYLQQTLSVNLPTPCIKKQPYESSQYFFFKNAITENHVFLIFMYKHCNTYQVWYIFWLLQTS